jgi:hypothetical protein
MPDEQPPEDVTLEILWQAVSTLRAEMHERISELESWRQDVDGTVGRIELALKRQTIDIVREVSGMVQSMVTDGMRSGVGEWFSVLFQEEQDRQRAEREALAAKVAEERRAEFKEFGNKVVKTIVVMGTTIQVILGILAILAAIVYGLR